MGKSANGRNYNYLNTNKNIVSKRINYTNIIKNQFNSKENIKRKLNRKENIYSNNININKTIDNENLKNKKIIILIINFIILLFKFLKKIVLLKRKIIKYLGLKLHIIKNIWIIYLI